jgi:hypothetical protein
MTDFSKLTKAQIDCMNWHAFGRTCGTEGSYRTKMALANLGFLNYSRLLKIGCVFGRDVWEMPTHIHIEWCAWVAKDVKEGDL